MTTRTLHRCRSCDAPIMWCVSENGERMPIDPNPVPGGNVRIVGTVARVVGPTIDMFDGTDDGVRHVAHFTTCPHAADWRTA